LIGDSIEQNKTASHIKNNQSFQKHTALQAENIFFTFNALERENLGVHGLAEVGHQVEVGQAHALQASVLYIHATKSAGTPKRQASMA
jgi:hypothetical protein